MRSNTDKLKKTSTNGQAAATKSGNHGASDKDSQRLAKISSKMGNGDLQKELSQNTAERDRLLAFICKRLEIMKGVQQIEQQELKHEREWYREVAKGNTGFHDPDPKRWHEPAKAFEKAAETICKGQLGKGLEQLEKALTIESKTFDKTPQMVQDKMKNEQKKSPAGVLSKSEGVGFGVICPTVKMPTMMSLVDDILNVSDSAAKSPPMPRPWWEMIKGPDEEEEEENEDES